MPGKLVYFDDKGGRGESIRSLLAHARFDYTDERIAGPEFQQRKKNGDFALGSIPVWEEDDFQVCQSNAILRMLGIRLGYYATDSMIAYQIDSLLDFVEDMVPKFSGYLKPAVFGGAELEVEAGMQWCNDYWKTLWGILEGRLSKHGR